MEDGWKPKGEEGALGSLWPLPLDGLWPWGASGSFKWQMHEICPSGEMIRSYHPAATPRRRIP